MLTPSFWLKRPGIDADRVLACPEDLKRLEEITASRMKELGLEGEYTPFSSMPYRRSAQQVKDLMASFSLPHHLFDDQLYKSDGSPHSKRWLADLEAQLNLQGLPEQIEATPALTTRRISIRAFPTDEVACRSLETRDVDLFQLTALPLASPLFIWHTTPSQHWSYIQSEIYSGWVESTHLAKYSCRDTLIDYCEREPRLVVTGSRTETEPNPFLPEIGNLFLQQGDSLPLLRREEAPSVIPRGACHGQAPFGCYVVEVPLAGTNKESSFSPALVTSKAPVQIGYRSMTRRNLIEAAFASLGERYGWGGSFERRDCSRLIFDIYRTAGLRIPRDAGQPQEEGASGESITFHGGREERRERLKAVGPGDPLYLPGHVMIYLGEAEKSRGRRGHYVIHAGAGYGLLEDGELRPISVHSTFIMELETYRMDRTETFLDALTKARKFYRMKE